MPEAARRRRSRGCTTRRARGGHRVHPVLLPAAPDRLARAVRRDVRRGGPRRVPGHGLRPPGALGVGFSLVRHGAARGARPAGGRRRARRRVAIPVEPGATIAVVTRAGRRCAVRRVAGAPRQREAAGSGADAAPGELGLDLALGLHVAVDLHAQLVRLRHVQVHLLLQDVATGGERSSGRGRGSSSGPADPSTPGRPGGTSAAWDPRIAGLASAGRARPPPAIGGRRSTGRAPRVRDGSIARPRSRGPAAGPAPWAR